MFKSNFGNYVTYKSIYLSLSYDYPAHNIVDVERIERKQKQYSDDKLSDETVQSEIRASLPSISCHFLQLSCA